MSKLLTGPRLVVERAPSHPDARRVFVGDLQGCRRELEQLLVDIEFRPDIDRLYPVGDLVNRGPDSLGTLRLLRQLDARPVLGNHDLHLLDVLAGDRRLSKGDTLVEVLEAFDREGLIDWLAEQPIVRVHRDCYQVHAGLHPSWTSRARLEKALAKRRGKAADDALTFCTRARFCDAKGNLPDRRVVRDTDGNPTSARWLPWYKTYDPNAHGGRIVVYGHWAMMGLVDRRASIGLDSGCVWGGWMTGYIPEEKRMVSIRAEASYAGNFRPR